ncbi:MAG: MBL fold metallo-hydrolase [Hydrotalea sp.]|nr:MBL fold metallo-hydrolase [Hydrotalea sp.]
MKIIVLGSGTSSGVPNLAFGWGDCDPHNPKNNRTRCSLYIQNGDDKILIDTGPDLRHQLLREHITDISAVLFTHDHADHCHGVDDLRPLMLQRGQAIPAFFTHECFAKIYKKFDYVFPRQKTMAQNSPADKPAGDISIFYPPLLSPNIIGYGKKFMVGKTEIIAFQQQHGLGISTGFRIGDFAYSTDVSGLDDAAFATLAGVKTWVVDALQIKPHGSHSNLANTLSWVARVRPERAFLTHLSIFMDQEKITAQCATLGFPHVMPLYDGQVLAL